MRMRVMDPTRQMSELVEKAREDRYASGHDVAVALDAVLAAPSGAAAARSARRIYMV